MSITATLGDIRGSRRCFGDHGLLFPDTRFTAVTHRFRDALSFGKVIAIFTESLQHKPVYNSLMDISHT